MTTPDIAGLCERLRETRSVWSEAKEASIKRRRNPDGPEAADALERHAAERDALRLAILGGEDVPGVAATVSIDQCIRFLTEERQRNEWSAEQQAKLERQAAEIARLREVLTMTKGPLGSTGPTPVYEAVLAALTGEDT